MDILALGECTTADYAWLDDCPYVSDTVYTSEFIPNDYVRVTQLYCNVVVSRLVNFLFFILCFLKGFIRFLKIEYN